MGRFLRKTIIGPTPFGPVAVIWSGQSGVPRLLRILLSGPGAAADLQAGQLYPGVPVSSCADVDALAVKITAFLEGSKVLFPLERVDWGECSAFQQSVLSAVCSIPRRCVSTYQLVAGHIAHRNLARAAGVALAHNPFPLIVPCHRVVRSDGYPGGFQGGSGMKRMLLEKERILFDRSGTADVMQGSGQLWTFR